VRRDELRDEGPAPRQRARAGGEDGRDRLLLLDDELGARWKASPMTYTAGGRQFVAVAAGSQIVAFALP